MKEKELRLALVLFGGVSLAVYQHGINRELLNLARASRAYHRVEGPAAKQAPGPCVTCGYFVRLGGSLGRLFGACANEYSPYDGRVTSVDHGCGGHSDVVADERGVRLPEPVFDTVHVDHSPFD